MPGGRLTKDIEKIITGDGFVREKQVEDANIVAADGSFLTMGSGNLRRVLASSFVIPLRSQAGTTDAAFISIDVPADYDEANDFFKVQLLVSTGTTDATTPAWTGTRRRAGVAIASLTAANGDAVAAGNANGLVSEVNLSGNGLKAGDKLTLAVAFGTHATNAVDVFRVSHTYRSNLRMSDDARV